MSTYSTDLRIQLIADGDQAGTWGQSTNNNLGTIVEQAIAGVSGGPATSGTYPAVNFPTDADITLTANNGTPDQARNAVLVVTSTGSLTAQRNIIAPASASKIYIINNQTSGGQNVQIKYPTGLGVIVANASTAIVYGDGVNFYLVSSGSGGTGSINSQFAEFTATQGQTVFTLPFTYLTNGKSLSVFVNGSKQIVNVNYTESGSQTITFLNGLNAGDLVECIYNYSIGSTSISSQVAEFTATAGQTVFNLPFTYTPNQNNLAVFLNGSKQIINVAYTETSNTVITFLTPLNVGDYVEVINNFPIAAGTFNSSNITYTQGGTGAVSTNVQAKLRESVSVKDFGADPTGLTDSTTAFTNAQTASKNVYIPQGTYLIDNLRIQNNVNLIGAGKEVSILKQGSTGNPAINCTSDVTTGQLLSLKLSNFGVIGKSGATVAAVLVAAYGAYAVYRSSFDFNVTTSFRALEVQGATANNVFDCDFKVNSVTTTDTSVLLNGGVYNIYDLFLIGPANGRALSEAGFNNTFTRLVTEGQIASSGQNTVFINPTIEEWTGTALPTEAAFVMSGFNQNLINPTLILNTANSAKVGYAFQPFSQTIFNAPRILVDGAVLLNPFVGNTNSFTIIGPGQNNCGNKMETIYNNADGSRDLRKVSFVGDCSSFTLNPVPHGGKSIQYLAPSGSFNLSIQNNTDSMIINGSGTIAVGNINYGYAGQTSYINGQTLSIWTANAITAFNFATTVSGVDVSLFPTSLTAGQKITYIYHLATNKFYPI
jgi:hypothetical protein